MASLARVDPSVVSRVLSDDPSLKVAPATRTRVLESVAALGYRPNAMARGLRLARTSTIGFVLPEISNPVYGPIVVGAQRRAEEMGYVIIIGSAADAASTEASFAALLSEGRVDGLLIASASLEDQLIRDLAVGPAPVVVVNRRVDGVVGSVIVDDRAGSSLATQHLISLGHRRIAHLAGPSYVDTTLRRRAGYEDAMLDAGIDSLIVVGADGWDASAGYRSGQMILSMAEPVTAVFVANVMAAIGLVRAAREHGLNIPNELSVTALHDFELTAFLEPPLTTVAMPLEELGARAVDMLLERLNGNPGRDLVIRTPPRLVVRGSTAAPVR